MIRKNAGGLNVESEKMKSKANQKMSVSEKEESIY